MKKIFLIKSEANDILMCHHHIILSDLKWNVSQNQMMKELFHSKAISIDYSFFPTP